MEEYLLVIFIISTANLSRLNKLIRHKWTRNIENINKIASKKSIIPLINEKYV